MPPSWVGAIMHSSVRISAGMSNCVPREFGDRPVAGLLHPPLQCVGAVEFAARVGIEDAIASATDAPGLISFAMDSCSATMRASSSTPHS